ncbi:hypothetical protein LIER_13228 [Lithospermum erythrorhizon]|uniref:Uncharacterized protein n=1 Tax=Lithospermum erythrorhizon TaxID=34254 RepID=A0AAV3PWW5_LITER
MSQKAKKAYIQEGRKIKWKDIIIVRPRQEWLLPAFLFPFQKVLKSNYLHDASKIFQENEIEGSTNITRSLYMQAIFNED